MRFVGRDAELDALTAELDRAGKGREGRFAWIQGRRRVGKSRLVQELCDRLEAPYVFYQAPQRDPLAAIAAFVDAVARSTLPAAPAFEGASFESWPTAIRAAVQGIDPEQPAILVIDELPYLTEGDRGFPADLQQAWDRVLEKAPVLLVCIGSDVRMMESLVGARSPLHSRPTLELRVEPLNPAEVAGLTAAPNAAAAFDRYLIVGGFPQLAASWPSGVGTGAFLRKALAHDQTPFAAGALRILTSEFPRDSQAKAGDRGDRTRRGLLRSNPGTQRRQGQHAQRCAELLTEQKRLVARELPYAVPPARRRPNTSSSDPYLRFWLRFVGPHMDELSRGCPDLAIGRIERDWQAIGAGPSSRWCAPRSSGCSIDPSLTGRSGRLRQVGAWWRRDHTVEVDLVGGDRLDPQRRFRRFDQVARAGQVLRRRPRSASGGKRAQVPGADGAKLVAVSRAASRKGSVRMQALARKSCWRLVEGAPSAAVSDNGHELDEHSHPPAR